MDLVEVAWSDIYISLLRLKTATNTFYSRQCRQNKQVAANQTVQYWLLAEVASAENTIRQRNLAGNYLNGSSPIFTVIHIMIMPCAVEIQAEQLHYTGDWNSEQVISSRKQNEISILTKTE
jgi:hypothetical protein